MQWVLQEFEDTASLVETLARMGEPFSLHKVVPFVGALQPEPEITDPDNVIFFGAYSLWRYAEKHGLKPGVFLIRPFLHEPPWQPFLLNAEAEVVPVSALPDRLETEPSNRAWFWRPVDDSKAVPGRVQFTSDISNIASKVLALAPDDIPQGSLRPDTDVMLCPPAKIRAEWRLWIVGGEVVTFSLYKQGTQVLYQPSIDADALAFGQSLVELNPNYSPAYVLDICRTDQGLRLLETNCLNAAGFYAADLQRLVAALSQMQK